MNSLAVEMQEARARSVSVADEALTVDLMDGRTIIVPLICLPVRGGGRAHRQFATRRCNPREASSMLQAAGLHEGPPEGGTTNSNELSMGERRP